MSVVRPTLHQRKLDSGLIMLKDPALCLRDLLGSRASVDIFLKYVILFLACVSKLFGEIGM